MTTTSVTHRWNGPGPYRHPRDRAEGAKEAAEFAARRACMPLPTKLLGQGAHGWAFSTEHPKMVIKVTSNNYEYWTFVAAMCRVLDSELQRLMVPVYHAELLVNDCGTAMVYQGPSFLGVTWKGTCTDTNDVTTGGRHGDKYDAFCRLTHTRLYDSGRYANSGLWNGKPRNFDGWLAGGMIEAALGPKEQPHTWHVPNHKAKARDWVRMPLTGPRLEVSPATRHRIARRALEGIDLRASSRVITVTATGSAKESRAPSPP